MTISENIFCLLGKSLFFAQKVEFVLHGIASHLGHLEEAKKDKLFSNITARDFLSNDPEKRKLRKSTLGQIYKLFGDRLLINNIAFDLFVEERNFFAHEFFRATSNNSTEEELIKRLNNFIELSILTEKAMQGLLSRLIEASAKKEGRKDEFQPLPDDEVNRKYYEIFVILHMYGKG